MRVLGTPRRQPPGEPGFPFAVADGLHRGQGALRVVDAAQRRQQPGHPVAVDHSSRPGELEHVPETDHRPGQRPELAIGGLPDGYLVVPGDRPVGVRRVDGADAEHPEPVQLRSP